MLARAHFRVSSWSTGNSGWVVLPHLLLLFGATTASLSPVQAATVESPPTGLQVLKVCDQMGHSIPCSSATAFGFFVFAKDGQTQLAVMPSCGELLGVLGPHEGLIIHLGSTAPVAASVAIENLGQASLEISAQTESAQERTSLASGNQREWKLTVTDDSVPIREKTLSVKNLSATASAVWKGRIRYEAGSSPTELLSLTPGDPQVTPPPVLPPLAPAIAAAMIEWDWRLQDELDHPQVPSSKYTAALNKIFDRGQYVIENYSQQGLRDAEWFQLVARWNELRERWHSLQTELGKADKFDDAAQETVHALWLEARRVKRQLSLRDPALRDRKIAFVKHVPSLFSHQLTQYTGNCARPGGGVYLLDFPGQSMACTDLTAGRLPQGSFEFCDVSPDGTRVLFSFCAAERAPVNREQALDRFFHLYEIALPHGTIRQLTSDPYDDFGAKYLPDGQIVFVSTRRGGFHRCGQGPCPVHTLALCDSDGRNIRVISFHETHEWDPVPLFDGRILYTRWDYVDRNAVFYQQLWTVRSNGEFVQAYYGNNTLNPVGIWEARPIPGTNAIIATAAAHHAMTAGSIIRIDIRHGQDGSRAITRLTPDALFPESEAPVPNRSGGRWFNPAGVDSVPALPSEQKRFPGHCYRTPYPLSETTFLAAYSYDGLIGEPDANRVNMFGLYWMDVFGNKELLYRDLNISSLWPVAFRPCPSAVDEQGQVASKAITAQPISTPTRPASFAVPLGKIPVSANSHMPEGGSLAEESGDEGIIFLANVYAAWPQLPRERITRLRIVQVLPKSTWHANQPTLGVPNISPGKQVLGTVPVEADGSALFRVPARKPLSFQALDEHGRAVQIMRSITYVQPGEITSCVGCHEPRHLAPPAKAFPLALRRPPSQITPGPSGSRPFSYPLLVQPVLDRHCVACHNSTKAEGGIVLTGEPAGRYSASYNALARYVPYSDWAGKPGDFRVVNCEPTTKPDFFGARASRLTQLLLQGHYGVKLSQEDWERLYTWMDCNVLFYGTFNLADQQRQQRGEAIAGPDLE